MSRRDPLERLVGMVRAAGADHLELAGWTSSLAGIEQAPLFEAASFTIAFGPECLARPKAAEEAIFLLAAAMARTGAGGTLRIAPGLALHSTPQLDLTGQLHAQIEEITERLGKAEALRIGALLAQASSAHGQMAFYAEHATRP